MSNRSNHPTGGGDREFDSIDIEEASISSVGEGNVLPHDRVTFSCEFIDEPFGDYNDPIIIHKSHFNDNEYRVGIKEVSTGDYELHKTPDFESFTQISANINGTNFQDHTVLDDGTFVLYSTVGSGTDVYTGTDLTSLTNQGTVIANENDCGVFREGDTIHIYTEDADNQDGVSSNKLSHWTTSTSDLTSSTQQSDAIDVTNRDWKTGDPDIVQIGDYYYMTMDNDEIHPYYNVALARSDDLYNWTIIQEEITTTPGGDMVLTKNGTHFTALTEFTGDDQVGIGRWRVYPIPMLAEMGVQGMYSREHETEEGRITEETYIRTNLSADITGVSANTWTNPADGERTDKRDEFNSSQQFSPDKTGRYTVQANVVIIPGADQDVCKARIWNVTDGVFVGTDELGRIVTSGTKKQAITFSETNKLESSKTYEIQVTDENSGYAVESVGSFYQIKWCPIQPDDDAGQ